MNVERNYRILYRICWPLVNLLYPYRTRGLENIPEGAALICPLHSNWMDPFIVAVAMGMKHRIRPLAKEEISHNGFFHWVMEKIDSIFISRGEADIDAYKSCLRALMDGDKLLIFPEGTRVHGNDAAEPKTGVIRMAARTRAPLVPVYLPRDKKLFRRVDIVFGEPYSIEKARHNDYEPLAQELMDKIWALKETL